MANLSVFGGFRITVTKSVTCDMGLDGFDGEFPRGWGNKPQFILLDECVNQLEKHGWKPSLDDGGSWKAVRGFRYNNREGVVIDL